MKNKYTLLLLPFFIIILISSVVSSLNWDNVQDYDKEKREYTITNAFGLPLIGQEIAKIKLTSDLNQLVPRGYQKVAEFKVENYDNYTNVFNDMEFYNLKDNSQDFTRDFDYKYKTIIKVPDYETICDENILGNGTVIKTSCRQEQTGLKDKVVWNDINKLEGLLKGNITIGIFTDVKKGDKVEWIPTLFGERLTEWAIWTESLNVQLSTYWKLDESGSDTNAIDSVNGIYNLTGINFDGDEWITGLIGNAFKGGGDDYLNLTLNNGKIEALDGLTTSYTINFWVNISTTSSNEMILLYDDGDGSGDPATDLFIFWGVGDKMLIGTGGGSQFGTIAGWEDNIWHMFTLVKNATTFTVYEDGVLNETNVDSGNAFTTNFFSIAKATIGTINFTHSIDEIGIWNRSLNSSDITQLYNGGSGITFTDVSGPTVTLNSPIEAFNTTNQTINFNGTVEIFQDNGIANVTLFIDGILNETNSSGINDTDYLFTKIISEGKYNWTYESCDNLAQCTTATTRTFTISSFIENTVTFNAEVLETSLQTFELNISTIPDILSVSAFLNYNGTRDVSTSSCVGLNCSIRNTIDIPLSALESENKSFFWEITVFDGSTSVTTNTTTNEQNVSRIHLETCDGTFTVQTLNFTTHNEQNLTRISPYNFDGTFDIWLGTGSIKRNNNFSDSSIIEKTLCISPSEETFFVDAQIEYNEPANITYVTRNYYFQNDTISNVSQDIFLYLLKSSFSTSFILKVQDDNLLPLEDHIIIIQRFYPGEDLFRTVQIAKTSENGKTIGFFETEIVDYRFIIKLNGQTLLTTTQQKIVGEVAPFTLTFTIGLDLGKPWKALENLTNLDFSLIFNKSTNVVTYTYVDTSGNFTLGTLIVQKQNFSFSTNTNLCSLNSFQASATLTCNLTSNGTGTFVAKGFITRGSIETLVSQINFIIESFLEVVGMLGVLLAWFLILISSFAFKFNEIAGIFMINATVIFVNIIGLVSFGMLAISALIAASIIIVVVMEK